MGHLRGPGRPSDHSCLYRLRLRGFSLTEDLFVFVALMKFQCQEMISAYRVDHGLDFAFEPLS